MNLAKEARDGIKWTSIARTVNQLANLGVIVLLARLLSPSDFGQLAMVTVVTGFIGLFGELGFGAALIQKKDLDERHLSSVFWLNVITAIVLAALIFSAAPLVGMFYRDAELIPLTQVSALGFLIAPLSMVQMNILQRKMQFRQVAIVEVSSSFLSVVAAISMALGGFGIWTLVWKPLIASITSALALWHLSEWRPKWSLDKAALKELFGFSSNLMGFSALNYWARQADDLLIGKFMGAAALGAYTRAYQLMMMPIQEVSSVLSRVMFPALSRVQHDKEQVRRIYLKMLSLIALVTFPLMGLLFAIADRGIPLVYGPQWNDTIPVLKIFCFIGMWQSIATTVGWLYMSQGRTDWMFRWGVVAGIILILGIVVGTLQGEPTDVALGYAAAVALISYHQFSVPGRLIGLKNGHVLRAIGPVAGCTALCILTALAVSAALPPMHDALHVVLQILGGAVVYVALLAGFRVKAFKALLALRKPPS